MKRATLLVALAVGLVAPSLSAQIRIGAIYSTSGPQAALDVPSWQGAKTLVGQVNRAGGVAGQPVELVLIPVDSTPESVAKALRAALKKDGKFGGFIGLSDTDLARVAAAELKASGLPFVTSGATSPKLPSALWRPRVFLACFGDDAQAEVAATWLRRDIKAATAAVLYDETATYPRLLSGFFVRAFRADGGRILRRVGFRPGQFASIPPSVLKADAIFLATESADEALPIIRTLRNRGFGGPIVGGDSFDNAAAWHRNPEARDVFFTTHAFPARSAGAATAADVKAFRRAYRKDWNGAEPGSFAGLGRDAALLLLRAAASSDGTGRGTVGALRSGTPLAGVTGRIAFPRGTQVPTKPVALVAAESPDRLVVEATPGSR